MKLSEYEYYKLDDNMLYKGDSLNVLKEMPDNSIDCIATDPPYGYSFMGKEWDSAFVSIDIWRECLRVLKDGAFAFIMSSPRQDCLSEMIVRLKQAGFQTGFTSIYYSYASGFPKAGNVSKLIDKKICKERLTAKLGRKPTKQEFDGEWKDFRKVIGKFNPHLDGGIRKKTKASGDFKGTSLKEFDGYTDITAPGTPEAKALDGSYTGFQPKPAVEVIIVVMKPISEKTYVEQALKNGKGITWLDDCRIPYEGEGDKSKACSLRPNYKNHKRTTIFECMYGKSKEERGNTQGRFPANLLVSNDCLDDNKIHNSGKLLTHHKRSGKSNLDKTFEIRNRTGEYANFGGDSGSYSRFFDLDKWWVERIKQLPESVRKVFPFLIVPKASKSEKNKGCDELGEKQKIGYSYSDKPNDPANGMFKDRKTVSKNIHPTAKPIKLMSYLITLGSRKKDIILDPFLGSGTTCISADLLGRQSIGIEREKEYIEIAKCRIMDEARQIKMF